MAPRFVGVRFDNEIVLLDRSTNSLIHLNEAAAQIWRACAAPDADTGATPRPTGAKTADAASVRIALTDAGLLRRAGDGYVRVAVEWP